MFLELFHDVNTTISTCRTPSNKAVQAVASSQPPRKRPPTSLQSSQAGPSFGVPPVCVQEIPLSADITDTIVRRVTEAVTECLVSGASPVFQSLTAPTSSHPTTSSAAPGLAPPANLHEVPIGSPPAACTTHQTQGAGPATSAPPVPGTEATISTATSPSSSAQITEAIWATAVFYFSLTIRPWCTW